MILCCRGKYNGRGLCLNGLAWLGVMQLSSHCCIGSLGSQDLLALQCLPFATPAVHFKTSAALEAANGSQKCLRPPSVLGHFASALAEGVPIA